MWGWRGGKMIGASVRGMRHAALRGSTHSRLGGDAAGGRLYITHSRGGRRIEAVGVSCGGIMRKARERVSSLEMVADKRIELLLPD